MTRNCVLCVWGVSLCLRMQPQVCAKHRTDVTASLSTERAEPGPGYVWWVGHLPVQVRDLLISCPGVTHFGDNVSAQLSVGLGA